MDASNKRQSGPGPVSQPDRQGLGSWLWHQYCWSRPFSCLGRRGFGFQALVEVHWPWSFDV